MVAPPHVVFFSLPVKGHLNPYLSIAHYLASHGVCVTFIHGPSYSASSASFSATSIQFAVMPELDPLAPAKPPPHAAKASANHGAEADNQNLSRSLPDHFNSTSVRNGLQNLLGRLFDPHESNFLPPSCIFTESFLPWTHDVALQFGMSRVEIWTTSAAVYSMALHFSEVLARGHTIPVKLGSPEAEKTLDFIPGVPPLCLKDLPFMLIGDNEVLREFVLQAFERCKEADRVLVNTFYELEGEAIDALREKTGVRIVEVGPLAATTGGLLRRLTEAEEEEGAACLGWLDSRPARSVVYVSFGSLVNLEATAVRELAMGLEASEQAFLWALRPGALGGQAVREVLPEGFQERTQGRGLIVSWAPQLGVLAHAAVSAFVTHCGWNSTTEAVAAGVPMIGYPLQAEQNTNLYFLCEVWRVAVRVTPDYHCPVSRDRVEECVRSVMTGPLGRLLRERVLALATLASQSPSSTHNLSQLVNDLHSRRLGKTAHTTS